LLWRFSDKIVNLKKNTKILDKENKHEGNKENKNED
jgi:hypothetical protein